jgi:hypothetical protein
MNRAGDDAERSDEEERRLTSTRSPALHMNRPEPLLVWRC